MAVLHHRDGHLGWDRNRPPVIEIAPEDELVLDLADCFDGQLPSGADAADVAALDLTRANPLTGPISVAGVEPGDVVAVEILDIEVGTVGWTTLIPGFGLLADEFPDAHVVVSRIDAGSRSPSIRFGDVASLPCRPMIGTLGLAPNAPGPHDVIPPRGVGGNLDCRDVRAGTTVLLPAAVDGGLLSAGDAHGTQADGEVCGTAVETTARVRVRVTVRHGVRLDAPRLELPAHGPVSGGPRIVTTGVGPDLHTGARDATRAMIDELTRRTGRDPADLYALCSVAGDLRIVEVVNAPNWVVAMELDVSVLA